MVFPIQWTSDLFASPVLYNNRTECCTYNRTRAVLYMYLEPMHSCSFFTGDWRTSKLLSSSVPNFYPLRWSQNVITSTELVTSFVATSCTYSETSETFGVDGWNIIKFLSTQRFKTQINKTQRLRVSFVIPFFGRSTNYSTFTNNDDDDYYYVDFFASSHLGERSGRICDFESFDWFLSRSTASTRIVHEPFHGVTNW